MQPSNNAVKESSKQVWGASPAGWTFGQSYKPGTKEFFDSVIAKRFSYEVPWLDEIVQFKRFVGKSVLEIGSGCGYDAYQFCKNGANYTGIDITPENPIAAKKHLSYYGYDATFLEMDVEKMQFAEQFDYIYTFGVLHHTPDMKAALKNCYRSLKPNGEIQIIVYNKWSIFYIATVFFVEWLCKGNWRKRTLAEQRSLIEYSTQKVLPLVNVYSARQLKRLLNESQFKVERIEKRKLTAEDLPKIRWITRLYKYIPQKFLDSVGRYFGWYLSLRAIKARD